MKNISNIFTALRQKNIYQYALLAACCFFSVLSITAYVCMMYSPTVLNVLPEGGDSRKQVMIVFVLAVLGCGMFTTYASGLFFRQKAKEAGVLMSLGMGKKQLCAQMAKELAFISFCACALGALLGAPLGMAVWQLFRIVVVDSAEMQLRFNINAYSYALAFSVFVICMVFFMLLRFIRRTNIIDVIQEARMPEPIKSVPKYYGIVGIFLSLFGVLLGFLTPGFFVQVLKWYAPELLTSVAYLPAFFGLYMVLLHTVVNGWRSEKNRYKNLISTSMMKFNGRQSVRNMVVICVLVAGAYFAAFYTPMLGTGAKMQIDARPVDYAFRFRIDQNIPSEKEILQMAKVENVQVLGHRTAEMAVLGTDGMEHIEKSEGMGISYTEEYRQLICSKNFLSQTGYKMLTGENVDIKSGYVAPILPGDKRSRYSDEVNIITNMVTGLTLNVSPETVPLHNEMLQGYYVLSDEDYDKITSGLTEIWLEKQVFFDAKNDTYIFAKRLFEEIVARSGDEVEVYENYDLVEKILHDKAGEPYWSDKDELAKNGHEILDYNKKDSSDFRLYWKYMPQFRILDRGDFVKTTAVFLMLFVFISSLCFSAVAIIAYTRSLALSHINRRVYQDLQRLGASRAYVYKCLKKQVAKVFFAPILTGTGLILVFYTMIMYFNDSGRLDERELAGLVACLGLVAVASLLLYLVYRFTLRRAWKALSI